MIYYPHLLLAFLVCLPLSFSACQEQREKHVDISPLPKMKYSVQHSNAKRLQSHLKKWRKDTRLAYSVEVIDSLAKESIFEGHAYELPAGRHYLINYVKSDFFEVIFLPERFENKISMPYYLVTPDSVYLLKY